MKIIVDNIQTDLVISGHDDLQYPELLRDLRNYMSVNVPGAYFAPQYKAGTWDGKRYFITPSGKMATGFLPVLAKQLDRDYQDLPIELVDIRKEIPTFRSNLITQIGPTLAEGDYEHQKLAIASLDKWFSIRESSIPFPRGIINAATNAGKMAIIAGSYLNLEGHNRMLVLIHNKLLFDQLVEYFEEVFSQEIGVINSRTYNPKDITVGMIKTLYNRIRESVNVKKDLQTFNTVAVDECHLAGSKTYQGVLKYVPAPVRIFVSGSPFDSNAIVNKMIAIGLSGPELYNISKRELMDIGISLEVKIHLHLCHELAANDSSYENTVHTRITRSARRAFMMKDIINNYKGSTLIAVRFIEHGQLLSDSLQLLGVKHITFVHGTDPEREQKIEDFKSGKIKTLISTSILKEGANMPIVSNIIIAFAGRDIGALKQWMGRGERKFEDRESFTFHDFYDIGPWVEKHSRARRAGYKRERLDITECYTKEEIRKIIRGPLV